MGSHPYISANDYPTQGDWVGRRVLVCFHYDTSNTIGGVVVREDVVSPGRMIIRLDDDRYVLSTECQYTPEETR